MVPRAATVPPVFESSVSHGLVPYKERFIDRIRHQLNTVMKKAMMYIDISQSVIGQDLERVQKIVKLFKKASINVSNSDYFALN